MSVSAFCAVRWVALDPADGGTKELSTLWKTQELLPSFGVLKVNPQHGARHRAAVHLLDTAHDHTHVPAHTRRHRELQWSTHLSEHGFTWDNCEFYTTKSLVPTSVCGRSHLKLASSGLTSTSQTVGHTEMERSEPNPSALLQGSNYLSPYRYNTWISDWIPRRHSALWVNLAPDSFEEVQSMNDKMVHLSYRQAIINFVILWHLAIIWLSHDNEGWWCVSVYSRCFNNHSYTFGLQSLQYSHGDLLG